MKILTRNQIKTAENDAVSNGVFSYKDLMANAGQALYCRIKEKFNLENKDICIVCGKGNNGGDGLVLAQLLYKNNFLVSLVFPSGVPSKSPANEFLSVINKVTVLDEIPETCDFLIDAFIGIGLKGRLEGEDLKTIEKMNNTKAYKIAVDVPSGFDADGQISSPCFNSDLTLTFIALKPGFVLPVGSDFCGETEVLDIGVTVNEYAYKTNDVILNGKRKKNTHKGTYGTALMLTGSYGMAGAQILSSKACLASGVGIAKAFVADKNYSAFVSNVPEAVVIPCETDLSGCIDIYDTTLKNALLSADAFLIGCGMGNKNSSFELIKRALLITNLPTVIDADGINAVATDINILKKIKAPKIITPHPKEMARLFSVDVEEIEKNRPVFAKRLATMYECTVVLKGANTVIASKNGEIFFNMNGNPGMATGGSGDVLSGIIVSLLAQGKEPLEAAKKGVYLHGLAGDKAAEKYSLAGLLPTDIIKELKTL